MVRVLVAGLFHETHGFVSQPTTLDDFDVQKGNALLAQRHSGSMIDGLLEVCEREGWEVVPACAYAATPSGPVEDAVVEAFWSDLSATVARGSVDAVLLALHGAMVSESHEDVEGLILSRMRDLPGLEHVPLSAVFDLHANLSPAMCRYADVLVCYRENPHIDARARAVHAADLLARMLREGRPRIVHRRLPVLWPPTGTGTADLPMSALETLARSIEADDSDIWVMNVVAGFSFGDTPYTGVAFAAVTCGDPEAAERHLDRMAQLAWALRNHGLPAEHDPVTVLADLAADPGHPTPVCLVEPSDNIGGGAPGNGTGLLRALLAAETENAGIIINDPDAVVALSGLVPGATTKLAIGGKENPFDPGPVTLDVTLVRTSDGRFTLEDLNSHMVAARGKHIDMGPSAVVRHAGLTILLTSRKTAPFDLGQWRSQGVEPRDLAVIGVKAAVAHRRAYDPIAAQSFTVATAGPCSSSLADYPYRRLTRPIFPLDPVENLQ
ncbi:M81 family metallopeptidase [Tabrizicola sp.]|uniref:M81 family metallopeptidase n=1 Tax=Tabrizicola sp. TaxID=2005166 RepID=UPI0025D4F9E7|nr:M81 family metallopeptidase [Tabrizicola sp.]MBY0352688.1 M81 family metallopeptidase [Tabrizicola sp.]